MQDALPVTIVSCGIFRRELAALGFSHDGAQKLVCLDSMLHMRPADLDTLLARTLRKPGKRRFLLAYGDCSPHMTDYSREPGVRRLDGVNCCEIVLGRERYRELRRGGAFFFMPEWTRRWERVFKDELGFTSRETAREFMREMHTRLIYLDTGVEEIPRENLEAVESFLGMPVEVLATGLSRLERSMRAGLHSLAEGGEA